MSDKVDTRMSEPESSVRLSTMPSASARSPSDMPFASDDMCGMPLGDVVGAVCELVHAGEPPAPSRQNAIMAGLEAIGLSVSNGARNLGTFLQNAFNSAVEGLVVKLASAPRLAASAPSGPRRG